MHRRLVSLTLLALGAAVVVGSLAAAAPLAAFLEFPANAGSAPFRIASGADGNLWFSDQGVGAKAIGRMTTSGTITAFGLPAAAVPRQVRVGSDGNLWFTDTNPAAPGIGRITPSGTIIMFPLELGSNPNALALGADGNLWFTDKGKNPASSPTLPAMGRITPDGTITKFRTGLNAGSSPNGITPAAGGFLWFTDQGTTKAIGRVQTSGASTGTIEEFSAGLGASANPAAITTAGDGTLWFTDQSTVVASRAIGRVTPDGAITESSVGLLANGQPIEVTPGADGKLWFSQQASPAGALGQITMTGATWTITNYPLAAGIVAGGIRTGSDGNIWFLDNNTSAQKIAQFGVGAPAASTGIAISGGGNLGALQTCSDTWSDWAGQQPSRTAFGFDGYRWLLDGNAIAGQTAQTYMPTAGDVGHQLSCKVTVTYTLFPTTVSATSAALPVKGAAEQIDDLGTLVGSLANVKNHTQHKLMKKLDKAGNELARGHTKQACDQLKHFVKKVQKLKTPKQITVEQQSQLVAGATRIESVLGC